MTEATSTWSLEGLKDALMGGQKDNVSEQEKTQATLNAALREETKLKEEKGEATGGWRKMLLDMTKDKDDLDEQVKKLEQELTELRADEADDTWTEKIAATFNGSRDARRAKITELEKNIAELKKQQAEKEEGWKGKLKDIFDGEDEEGKERLKQQVNTEASWKDKLGEHFFGTPKEEPKKEEFSFSGKLNELAGGGKKSEVNEDKLDKLVDLYQEHVLKQGQQNDESAFEQAKDEQISDAIRAGFKMVTGKEVPLKDKEH
ncbi:unnamed protein product [Rhizoctonia solani]|uniref:Uncharacterized protein n=1 Tax=Rhizoctonia solani TaxID=456999 RepID=A0A8H3CRC1_9AGAM|nr:unnamed protein product [Rhizoctonia solani]CAE7172361.1 unnamed protein product [Rhizoctonia solani]